MGLHITKDRDNLKEEVIEINSILISSNIVIGFNDVKIDFGFYYYDLQQKNFIDQRHIDALIDLTK